MSAELTTDSACHVPLAEIDAELKGVTDRILTMIGGLTK